MSCATCDHTMTPLGCKVTDKTFYWCPRCGTIKPCEEAEAVAPALISWLREFEKIMTNAGMMTPVQPWLTLGIAESIHPPEDRPEHTEETLKGGDH